jgi:hypothetical protein
MFYISKKIGCIIVFKILSMTQGQSQKFGWFNTLYNHRQSKELSIKGNLSSTSILYNAYNNKTNLKPDYNTESSVAGHICLIYNEPIKNCTWNKTWKVEVCFDKKI